MKNFAVGKVLRLALLFAVLVIGFNNCAPFRPQVGLRSSTSAFDFDPGFKFQCVDPSVRGASETTMRRLTKPQLVNTLNALVGSDVMADNAIQTQFKLLNEDSIIASVSDVPDAPPDTQPMAMLTIAMAIADQVLADNIKIKRVFGECASSSMTDACMQSFVSSFGLKTFRRPLTGTESEAFFTQYKNAGGGVEGMNRVLARMLMSPSLVYHIELGTSASNGRIRLTDYEVASRLSYRLVNSIPDKDLFDAAANGSLSTLSGVRAQANRLFTLSGRATVTDFFRFYMHQDSVPTPNTFAANLDGVDPAGLKGEMVQELRDYINNVVWTNNGQFEDLFQSSQVFPRSAGMAKILQAPVATNGPTETNADHVGLILRPAFLAGSGPLTSPYHRALTIRSGLLCEKFKAPDPKQIAERQTELGDLSALSNRDRLTRLTKPQICMDCHGTLNPIAFVLEGYDQLGMKRTMESTFDSTGTVTQQHPIVTSVTNTFILDGSGVVRSFDDATDLQRAIASSTAARGCFAQRIFEYQRARSMTDADFCALSEVEKAATSAGTIQQAFISGVANADIFFKAQGN